MNIQDIIIVIILIVILVPAIKSSITHMKGEGECCGGPKEKPVKKKISGKPKSKKIVYIEGMHCDNCKNRIEKHLDELDGVIAKVKLSRKLAEVLLYEDVDDSVIRDTIESLDFQVTKIETVK